MTIIQKVQFTSRDKLNLIKLKQIKDNISITSNARARYIKKNERSTHGKITEDQLKSSRDADSKEATEFVSSSNCLIYQAPSNYQYIQNCKVCICNIHAYACTVKSL